MSQSPEYVIARAIPADMEQVVDLCMAVEVQHEAYWPLRWAIRPNARPGFLNWLRNSVNEPRILILVAKPVHDANLVIGTLVLNIQTDIPIYAQREYAFVQDIAVLEAWRRNKVAQALLLEGANWARHAGINQVRLMVAEQNPAARAAFAKSGFRETYHEMVLPLMAEEVEGRR